MYKTETENPRVGGSIPSLGTTTTQNNKVFEKACDTDRKPFSFLMQTTI